MAKRKTISSAVDYEDNFTEEEPDTSSPERSIKEKFKKAEVMKLKREGDEPDEDEDDSPKAKKSSKRARRGESEEDDVTIRSTSEGEKYIDLGKKKRATVRTYKGTTLVDIREFYGADGDEKPGKKGISLTLEQWKTLKKGVSAVDSLFAETKK